MKVTKTKTKFKDLHIGDTIEVVSEIVDFHFFKKGARGKIIELKDSYLGVIVMLDDGTRFNFDPEHIKIIGEKLKEITNGFSNNKLGKFKFKSMFEEQKKEEKPDYIKQCLEEFDKKFPLIKCDAHERTSNSRCICEELEDINRERVEHKQFLEKSLTEAMQKGYTNGFRDGEIGKEIYDLKISEAKKEALQEYKQELKVWAEKQVVNAGEGTDFNSGVNAGMRYLIQYINI